MKEKHLELLISFLCLVVFFLFVIYRLPDALNGTSPEDFPNYYFAAKRLIDGQAVYDLLSTDVQENLGWHYDVYPADPPFTIVAFTWLPIFDYFTAWKFFVVMSVIAYLWALLIALKELGANSKNQLIVISLSLIASPFLFLLYRNHFESILLLLLVLGWKHCRNKKPKGTTFLGITAALKLFPMLWIALFAYRSPRKKFLIGTSSALVFSTLGVLILGLSNTSDFVFKVLPQAEKWLGSVGNYSLLSFFTALRIPEAGWLACSLLIVFFALNSRYWKCSIDLFFLRAVTLSLLLSPLSWINYQILLFPFCFWLVLSRSSKNSRWLAILVTLLLMYWPGYAPIGGHYSTVLVSSIPTFLMLGLLAVPEQVSDPYRLPERQD